MNEMGKMEPAIFIPTEGQKKMAGHQSVEILNTLTEFSTDLLYEAYVLQLVLESFEEEYEIDIRKGYSISNDERFRPKPK